MPATRGLRQRFATLEAAAIAGIVAAVGWVVALARLTRGPGVDASEAEISEFFADPDIGWDVLVLLQVLVIATAAFLWFIGVIRNRVGEAAPTMFDTVFFGGGILFAGLMFLGSAALAVPFLLAEVSGSVDPGAASMIRGYAQVILAVFAPRVAALIVFSSSTLGLRTGALPRWLILAGYVVGTGLIINVTFWNPSLYVFPGWMVLMSLVLLFHHPKSAATEITSSRTDGQ
ncbi:MAG: hypothetical protein QNJ77_03250 [Acidimicrobiia bacterium]|nr:hypothetical protein [Acidimicrobiia bacterium]